MTATSKLRSPSLNSLYLKRRSQRNHALKKVVKQSDQLRHTKWFFDTLESYRVATEGHDFVPDHLLDLIADTIEGDESLFDVAVDRLAVANKRLHEVRDAMDRKRYSYRVQECVVNTSGGNCDLAEVTRSMFHCGG
jgi:hypothetical protein